MVMPPLGPALSVCQGTLFQSTLCTNPGPFAPKFGLRSLQQPGEDQTPSARARPEKGQNRLSFFIPNLHGSAARSAVPQRPQGVCRAAETETHVLRVQLGAC